MRSPFAYRPGAQEKADALRVRRMVLDLIAGVPGEWDEDGVLQFWEVRGLSIVRGHDPDDEFSQRLGVLYDNNPVFSIYWTPDDSEQKIAWFVPGAWERRLVP